MRKRKRVLKQILKFETEEGERAFWDNALAPLLTSWN